ncbi:hypothetical protein EG327_000686 [Venturia inaequalis]|uniref:Uncharacterized protein n=1 Tax=Venturia inaequalis TaxID=5025 RepID=A0A8H3VNL2_VENIN|nr:hypothetical protein EG327_000686 [Venturia inaequalis]
MPAMESTTLITFILNHPNARKVELLGSWDNFSGSYAMTKDSRRGHGIWSGCHTFKNIICDGDSDIHEARSGGLKMGGTYWYFYRIDDDEEYHDLSQPATSACPLLPGQTLNVLEVPCDTGRYVSRSRSSSISISSAVQTLNPDDRYLTPRPAPTPKLAKLITSAEAAAASGHIFTPSTRDRPWTAEISQGSNPWDTRSSSRGQDIKSASPSPTSATNILKSAFMQLKGPVAALTPSKDGRGRSRVLHPGPVRHHRTESPSMRELRKNISRPVTAPSQSNRLRKSMNESTEMPSAPRHLPLIHRKRPRSPNHLVSRIQETERPTRVTIDSLPEENIVNELGQSVLHRGVGRLSRSSHRRGFSEDFATRRSASLNGKRAPSPRRSVAMNQADCRAVDSLQISTGIPELDGEDVMSAFRFPNERPQTPNHNMDFPTTICQHSRSSSANTNKEGYSVYQMDFDVPLLESPTSAEMPSDTEAYSPAFSSIKGGNSGSSTPYRLSDPPEWPLRNEELRLNFNRSIEKLSVHARSVSTTSTALYSLPLGCDGNPFATEKSHEAQSEVRQLSQMEQLLDEFEYLGAALL